mmetsp:Transcript_26707/g.75780  ORF Transcript_26707/g.75780 Transcript_26707/m.75780 type:complete len:232 (-) Transcript_26707:64-759(-)
MQATHNVPDEVMEQHGLREPATLIAHETFADNVLGYADRPVMSIMPDALGQAREALHWWRALMTQFSGRRSRWTLVGFFLEALSIAGLAAVSCYELFCYCPLEVGPLLSCRHCFGGELAVWGIFVATAWCLHLQLSILMVSRGFCFCPKHTYQIIPGVPAGAVRMFVYLSVALVIGLVAGVLLLLGSISQCRAAPEGLLPGYRARSEPMTAAAGCTVVVAPLLLFFGRVLL